MTDDASMPAPVPFRPRDRLTVTRRALVATATAAAALPPVTGCPACGGTTLKLGECIAAGIGADGVGFMDRLIVTTCADCGHERMTKVKP